MEPEKKSLKPEKIVAKTQKVNCQHIPKNVRGGKNRLGGRGAFVRGAKNKRLDKVKLGLVELL